MRRSHESRGPNGHQYQFRHSLICLQSALVHSLQVIEDRALSRRLMLVKVEQNVLVFLQGRLHLLARRVLLKLPIRKFLEDPMKCF